jgi:hypothetical protein
MWARRPHRIGHALKVVRLLLQPRSSLFERTGHATHVDRFVNACGSQKVIIVEQSTLILGISSLHLNQLLGSNTQVALDKNRA